MQDITIPFNVMADPERKRALELLFGQMWMGAGTAGYIIVNSCRFRSAGSTYLSRLLSSPTDGKAWSFSTWVKRGKLGAFQALLATSQTAYVSGIWFNSSDQIQIDVGNGSSSSFEYVTSAVYRDTSAWMHIHVVYDSANVAATNRLKLYVNGAQSTFTSAVAITQNFTCGINSSITNYIGYSTYTGWGNGNNYIDAYCADTYLIDGQALTPSSFGKADSNGVWVPIKYPGTYGTNGCKLEFKNSAALGTDTSGNGGNWTTSGLASTDQMVDTPTNNYCTLNPVATNSSYSLALSNGNLTGTSAGSARYLNNVGTIGFDVTSITGIYFEVYCPTANGYPVFGITSNQFVASSIHALTNGGSPGYGRAYVMPLNGSSYHYNNGSGGYGTTSRASVASGWFGVAVKNGKMWVRDSAGWWTGDPVAGTSPIYTGLTGTYFPAVGYEPSGTTTLTANFGQSAFNYSQPSGFVTLCTANLPSVAVLTSGTFTGNANADGPFIWINGNPDTLTINGNAVTFGTHVDKTAGGFKLRSSSASYNASGENTWTATAGKRFVSAGAVANTAQGNP